MSKSKIALLLAGILIIASFLRLYHLTLTPPGLYPDEAMDGTNAQEALQTGQFKVYYPENNGREGLFMNVQAVFLKVIGQNEPWVLRLPSALFGIGTVLGVYFLAAELFGAEVGLLAALLIATNFWHINFSRISFRAITAPFFLVWAMYFLIAGFRKIKNGERFGKATLFHIVGGIFFGLGFYTYIAYRVMPILALFVIISFWRIARRAGWQKNALHTAGHFLFFTFIVALPIGLYYLHNPADFLGRTSQVSIFSAESPIKSFAMNIIKTLGMFNVAGDYNWRHNYSGAPELFLPVGLLFLAGIILGIRSLFRKYRERMPEIFSEPFSLLFVFLWFALAMLPVVISNEGIPHALRSILLIPPAIILATLGGVAFFHSLKRYLSEYWLKAIMAFAVAMFVSQAYAAYFVSWAKNPNVPGAFAADYVELGHTLNALPPGVPKYIVVKAGGVLVHGIPMPSQTVMFITDTYTQQGQQAKNIHYVLPEDEKNIPAGALTFYIQ